MKKIIFFSPFLFLIGCSKDPCIKKDPTILMEHSVLLLRVDYSTQVFEGGQEVMVKGENEMYDSIPIRMDYDPPGDVGSLGLLYQPSNDTVFYGSEIWMGKGEIYLPKTFLPPTGYTLLQTTQTQPPDSTFQLIPHGWPNQVDYVAIWNSINKLEIVETYLKSNKKIGILLYTPTIATDTKDWKWFVIMDK